MLKRKQAGRLVAFVLGALLCATSMMPSAWAAGVPTTAPGGEPITTYETQGDYLATNPTAQEQPRALASQSGPAVSAASATWTRLAGANRYETMMAIAEEECGINEWAIIACGDTFAEALVSSALAGAKDCPVLIAKRGELTNECQYELQRMGVQNVYVVQSGNIFDQHLYDQLESLGINVTNIAGVDDMSMSLAVRAELRDLQESDGGIDRSDMVIVATSKVFADALSIAPWAYSTGSPILLTGADGLLTNDEVSAIKGDALVKRIVIVGGEASVSDDIKTQLGAYEYERLGGKDRYETSRLIAEWEIGHGYSWNDPCVAAGTNFPDALCGAPLAGMNKSVMMLAENQYQTTTRTLYKHRDEITQGYILGGTSSVTMDDPLAYVDDDPMSLKAQEYGSPTGWLIMIDCTLNKCGVYNGNKGEWMREDMFPVTTGKLTTPTARGVFSTYDRGYAFDGDVYTCYYYTAFYGSYLMHSIIYDKHTFNVRDGQLGTNGSMGCVRMPIEKAQWVYENIPLGTTVVTF